MDVAPLQSKYGPTLFETPPLLTPARFADKLGQRDAIDPHFARISMEFASRVMLRPGLDRASRYLVQIGQFAVSRSHGHLEDVLRGAIADDVPLRRIAEAIFLTHIYAGDTVLEPALQIFTRVADALGVTERVRDGQLPLGGRPRDLETERASWPAALQQDPRAERLIEIYGWQAVSTGVRYRGTHHLDSLEAYIRQDVTFGRLWETFVYEGLYSRGVLDDKTRLLCTTGDCLALGSSAAESARDHMEEALHFGNSPREVLELIFMTSVFFGFPGLSVAKKTFFSILEEQGRLHELAAPTRLDGRAT